MKYITILVFVTSHLLGAGFWTLTGITKANIYVKNEISYLKQETIITAKERMNSTLLKNGINTQEQDAPTLMLELEDIEEDETHYVYLKLALGEEVKTYREDKTETFALTYLGTDFIDIDVSDLDNEVLESLDFLLLQFIEQFEEDKE